MSITQTINFPLWPVSGRDGGDLGLEFEVIAELCNIEEPNTVNVEILLDQGPAIFDEEEGTIELDGQILTFDSHSVKRIKNALLVVTTGVNVSAVMVNQFNESPISVTL